MTTAKDLLLKLENGPRCLGLQEWTETVLFENFKVAIREGRRYCYIRTNKLSPSWFPEDFVKELINLGYYAEFILNSDKHAGSVYLISFDPIKNPEEEDNQ